MTILTTSTNLEELLDSKPTVEDKSYLDLWV